MNFAVPTTILEDILRRPPDGRDSLSEKVRWEDPLRQLGPPPEEWSEKIADEPRNPELYVSRGLAFEADGDFVHAVEDYTEALRLGIHDSDTYGMRARCFVELGESAKALADFNKGVSLFPQEPLILSQRADLYLELESYDKATADYEKVSRLIKPEDLEQDESGRVRNASALLASHFASEGLLKVASVLLEQGQPKEAIKKLAQALELTPQIPTWSSFYLTRAKAWVALGEIEKARDNVAKARLEFDKPDEELLKAIGEVP